MTNVTLAEREAEVREARAQVAGRVPPMPPHQEAALLKALDAYGAAREALGRAEELELRQREAGINKGDIMTDIDLLELAWGIIANAGGSDWSKETAEWQAAAVRWRDQYHERLASERGPEETKS